MAMEIEKKYLGINNEALVNFLKENTIVSEKLIEQTYILPNDNQEVRYRKEVCSEGINFYRTTKEGSGLVRVENEEYISEKEFYNELRKTSDSNNGYIFGKPISKKRFTVEYKGMLVEIDLFSNLELEGLVLIEVEFPTIKEANSFNPYFLVDFVDKEVTTKSFYKNKNLWKHINNVSTL